MKSMPDYSQFGWPELIQALYARPHICPPADVIESRRELLWLEIQKRLVHLSDRFQPHSDEIVSRLVLRMLQTENQRGGLLMKIAEAENPDAYVKSTVRNELRMMLREAASIGRHEMPLSEDVSSTGVSPQEFEFSLSERTNILVEVYRARFQEALAEGQLTTDEFELIRAQAAGKSLATLAEEWQITVEALAKRLSRAKRKYRRFFSSDDTELVGTQEFAERLADALEDLADDDLQ